MNLLRLMKMSWNNGIWVQCDNTEPRYQLFNYDDLIKKVINNVDQPSISSNLHL